VSLEDKARSMTIEQIKATLAVLDTAFREAVPLRERMLDAGITEEQISRVMPTTQAYEFADVLEEELERRERNEPPDALQRP
jgi:hypothetical protein